MNNIGTYIAVAGGLIALYLVVTNWEGFKAIINALALGNVAAISALQGRGINYGGASFAAGAPTSRR